jgi:hypothetical protein
MTTAEQVAAWLKPEGPSYGAFPGSAAAWSRFAEKACQMGLAGLILEAARSHGIDLPQGVLDRLTQQATLVAANNLNTRSALEPLLEALKQAGIDVMLLKGAALNLSIYARPDLRPTTDADLLIKPQDVPTTTALLESAGCRRGFDLIRDDFFPKYHYEAEFLTQSTNPLRIDLHARPFRPLRVSRTMPDDAFFKDAAHVRLGNAEALVPSTEDTLIHLAAHAAFHGCSRLLWLYDIHRFLLTCSNTIDWDRFLKRTETWRLSLAVWEGIYSATRFFGKSCPETVLRTLAGQRTTWRDRLTLRSAPDDARSPVVHVAVNLLCTPGVKFKLGYIAALLLPGRNHLAHVYPFRHAAWVPCAHLWRMSRTVLRVCMLPLQPMSRRIRLIASK